MLPPTRLLLEPSDAVGLLGSGEDRAASFSSPIPEGPSTQYLRTLIKTIAGMVFGTRTLKYWVLGPSG